MQQRPTAAGSSSRSILKKNSSGAKVSAAKKVIYLAGSWKFFDVVVFVLVLFDLTGQPGTTARKPQSRVMQRGCGEAFEASGCNGIGPFVVASCDARKRLPSRWLQHLCRHIFRISCVAFNLNSNRISHRAMSTPLPCKFSSSEPGFMPSKSAW